MKITILHLSDIHFRGSEDVIVKRAQQIAASSFSSARLSDACFIIVTGDIAFSGGSDQYVVANSFLSEIKTLILNEGCKFIEVLLVPGNHDCVLKPEIKSRSLLISSVIENPENAEDDSVVDSCVAAQDNYLSLEIN